MDDLKILTPWPPAQRSKAILVQHPAWEEARNAVLDLAAEGPVTVFLTGEPGCGKTWLLRELATSLADHGFPTMMLLRGDLPVPLSNGAAVLIDEAHYMGEATRAELATQQRGVVILADLVSFPVASAEASPGEDAGPVPIHLRQLSADEVGPFAEDWLTQKGLSPAILDASGLARLIVHGHGAVRLVSQHLTAALAQIRAAGQAHVTGAVIDSVAALRLGELVTAPLPEPEPVVAMADQPIEPPTLPDRQVLPASVAIPPPDRKPRRRTIYPWALGGAAALAASVLAAVGLPAYLNRAPSVEALPAVQSAQITPPDVLPAAAPVTVASRAAQGAETVQADAPPAPAVATVGPAVPKSMPPLQAALIPAPATAPAANQPPLAASPSPPAVIAALSLPRLADADQPQPAPSSAATLVPAAGPQLLAVVTRPQQIPVVDPSAIAATPAVSHRATAGLMLVAQRGDTLERLYDDIYRDRLAPPFTEILAANPRPFKPGAVVVFPEPIGGWARHKP